MAYSLVCIITHLLCLLHSYQNDIYRSHYKAVGDATDRGRIILRTIPAEIRPHYLDTKTAAPKCGEY
jgi:hypothetical protein